MVTGRCSLQEMLTSVLGDRGQAAASWGTREMQALGRTLENVVPAQILQLENINEKEGEEKHTCCQQKFLSSQC